MEYFDTEKLEIITKTEEDTKMFENYNIVEVVYNDRFDDLLGSNRRDYCINYISDVAVGDLVVTATTYGRFKLGKVTGISKGGCNSNMRYDEVLARVDLSEYVDRVRREKERADIKSKMAKRAQTIGDMELYRIISTGDPEMAKLIKEYEDVK